MLTEDEPMLRSGLCTGNAQTERKQKEVQRFVAKFNSAKRRRQPRRKIEQQGKFPVEAMEGFHVRKTLTIILRCFSFTGRGTSAPAKIFS